MDPPRFPPLPVAAGATTALDLGVAAEVVQAQIAVGDLLAAEILAPQGGYDLIQILGRQILAQLPPGVNPGQTLLLQVSAFAGNRILVRNLGLIDPNNPPATVMADLPPASPQTAALVTVARPGALPPPAASPPAASATAGAPASPPAAPPRAVFVAASVRRTPRDSPTGAAPPAERVGRSRPAADPAAPLDPLEARIAASRAAVPAVPTSLREPPAAPHMKMQREAPAGLVTGRGAAGRPPSAARAVPGSPDAELESLRVPRTPVTLSAARLLSVAAERLPELFARLESLLPQSGGDARVSTLRTLLGFVARLNPADERAFAQRISAYVGNVLEGFEPKLAAAARARLVAAGQLRSRAPATAPVVAQAKAVERTVAAQSDLKALVLALAREPSAPQSPALAQALNETLTMLTAAQLNTLSANAGTPDAIGLTLPVFYHPGGRPATVRISRDAPGKQEKMDADNFHVAFVLDTASLGTVAIDLETVGRSVRVNVKTERPSSAERFGATLGELRDRLERLRYRVASADAAVASRRAHAAAPRGEPPAQPPPNRLDFHV
ncbi:MAG: flagellar hook-length control protein FliK [Vulcanimicrobiaceae bacterium]